MWVGGICFCVMGERWVVGWGVREGGRGKREGRFGWDGMGWGGMGYDGCLANALLRDE